MVFNEKWISYGKTVAYRVYGAIEVAKVGGLASLIRSVTPFSIYSPHTGWQVYEEGIVCLCYLYIFYISVCHQPGNHVRL